ncbi:MAG: FAD:protein FMN transferase [Nitrospirota bacterium]|nr:FAD:protein FMN transferase [Nitrospirota bacterium]MDH5586845.1 FAD:protein FMN transferase [Nitrospirota bacterium]MDH5773474.1 FAD:protein FMN transferase [Nitrospirota bacterium]
MKSLATRRFGYGRFWLIGMLAFGIAATSVGEALAKDSLIKRSQYLMGTLVFVTGVAQDEETAKTAVTQGLAEIRRIEQLMSTWIPTSELSKVNAAAGKHSVPVSLENMEVLKASLRMAQLTEGGFNIAVGPAVTAWNVSQEGRIPSLAELDAVRPFIALDNVVLDEAASTVFLNRAGMQIDVGGIGKGYAADLVVEVMKKAGATAGVVALSGDIKTFGRMPDQERFVFGIQHPRKEQGEVLGRIELENEAVSTAGDYQRFIMKDGIRYHHILDPTTLQPARGCQSVTIIAKDGVMADGLDTGIFVMGSEKGMALIESLPDVEGVIVDQHGKIRVSSGLRSRLMLASQSSENKNGEHNN